MDSDGWAKLQAQVKAIKIANQIAEDVKTQMEDLIKQMSETCCVICGSAKTDTWLATVCPDAHVYSTRVCKNCRNRDGVGITNKCHKCGKPPLDWAVKSDDLDKWLTSWGELLDLPQPRHNPSPFTDKRAVHLRMGILQT